MIEITFRQTSATTADMEITYPIGGGEYGSEHKTYHTSRPANVIKETRLVTTKAGRKIQCGIQVRDGRGYGVAWPA